MKPILTIIASYLIGSISFAWLFAKLHSVDLRKVGSGNLGATNVSRALGKKWAYACFACDVLKGLIPTAAAKFIFFENGISSTHLSLQLAVGAAAIMGHVFPLYLKFKGGKGAATSLGVMLGLWPYYTIPGLIVFVIWAVAVLIWKYISLASIIAAVIFPILLTVAIAIINDWKFADLWPLIATAVLLGAMVVFLHRKNITRLIAGNENKVLQKD